MLFCCQNSPSLLLDQHRFAPLACLLPPYAKILAQLVANRIRPLVPLVITAAQDLWQYAYSPTRQAADALDQALTRCSEVRDARKSSAATTIWKRRQGCIEDSCSGGITLSLDLNKAFDSVSWTLLEQVLGKFAIPAEIAQLIMFLHCEARYLFTKADEVTSLQLGQGIRQGCGTAPSLWTLHSLSLTKRLANAAPGTSRTLFADDIRAQRRSR